MLTKDHSHPYFKLLPPLLIGLAVAVYAIIHLTQPDVLGVPLHYVTHQSNHTTFASPQDIHQISPSISDNNSDTKTPSPTTITLKTENISVWQNISYHIHNKYIYLPEYHLQALNSDILNANPLKNTARDEQIRAITGNNQHIAKDKEYASYISLFMQQSSIYKNVSWYKDLPKYKLQLQCITLRANQPFVSYPINKRFMLYPQLKLIEYLTCTAPQGYGNGLSVYWGVRSLAYWMNYHFKINCKAYQQHAEQNKNKLMSAFLPSDIASNAHINMPQHKVVTFVPAIDPVPEQHDAIHPTSLIFMYYNPYFQHIMNYETMRAFMDYYKYIDGGEKRMDLIDQMSKTHDIVIHIRCGDVLTLMHQVNDWEYGFLTMAHYRYVMDIALQKRFGIDWYARITNKTTVWVLSQLTNKSARKVELQSMTDCEFLIKYIVENGLKHVFKAATVQIMYDSDVNDDFYRMLTAPLLFCSPSTYCFNAAMANMNGIVVIPNRGAWVDFFNIDPKNKNDNYSEDKTQDFIVASNSDLIPKNQLIVDTEKNGWHCNKIDNYDNKQSYKQTLYAHKLAEYLIAH